MADAEVDHDALISQFCELTGSLPDNAEQYLVTNRWDISAAVTEFYVSQEEGEAGGEQASVGGATSAPPAPTTGPRTLAGDPAPPSMAGGPIPSSSTPRTSQAAGKKAAGGQKKKFATLNDLNRDSGPPSGPSGGGFPGSDSEDDDQGKQDLFAGGEKSGLAVQNPDDPRSSVRDILDKAKRNIPRPGGDDPVPSEGPRNFRGAAQTLGGDDAPSVEVPDPEAPAGTEGGPPRRSEPVTRSLHFWTDGFSVEDGPLCRYDDPAHADTLNLIRTGRAPLDIMDVEPDQAVDLNVQTHQDKYVRPKKSYKPFGSGGQRLGSPTPAGNERAAAAPTSAADSSRAAPTSAPGAPAGTSTGSAVPIDDTQPVVSLQIRLGDGTRIVSRFNTTHTVEDVYNFVASSTSDTRPWVLMTTFPTKEITEKRAQLGDVSELKRGGVVVQKWQ